MAHDGGAAAYHTKATVLVPGTLSYCVVRSEGHYEALSSMYPTPTELLEHSAAASPSRWNDDDDCSVALWVLEHEPHTQAMCDYHPFHLDFGPWTWMQASRMLATINDVRSHVGALRSARRRARGADARRQTVVRRASDVQRALDDDEDTPSDGSGLDTSAPKPSGTHDDDDSELDCPMVLVVVRLFLGLPHATNLIACLGVMAVLAGVVTDPGSLHTYFPFDTVMRWTVPFHDATPYDDVEAHFDLTAADAILAALHAFQLWPSEMLDAHRFVVAHDYFQRLEHGDISWIAPWKYVAFASPGDDGAYPHPDAASGDSAPHRSASGDVLPRAKSAAYYASVFSEPRGFYGTVGTVVQLNDNVSYDGAASFGACGIQHETLFFTDGSFPTPQVVAKFFGIVDAAQSRRSVGRLHPIEGRPCDAIALHCMAGLGRTGTLICLALMRDYGFTAKAAIAWSRLCRPGSVIGPQQAFLCYTENQWKRSLFDDTLFTKAPSVAAEGGGRTPLSVDCPVGLGTHRSDARSAPIGTVKTTSTMDDANLAKLHQLHTEAGHRKGICREGGEKIVTTAKKVSSSAAVAPPVAMDVDRTSLVEIVINRNLSSAATTSASASGSSVVFRPRTHGGVHSGIQHVPAVSARMGDGMRSNLEGVAHTRDGPALLARYTDAHRDPTLVRAKTTSHFPVPQEQKESPKKQQRSTMHDAQPSAYSNRRHPDRIEAASKGTRRRREGSQPLFTTYTVGHSPPATLKRRDHHVDAEVPATLSTPSRLPASVQSWLDEDAQRLKGRPATPPPLIKTGYRSELPPPPVSQRRTEDTTSRTATSSTTHSNQVHHVSITL